LKLRREIIELVNAAVAAGATMKSACDFLGVSERNVQRWRKSPDEEDGRRNNRFRTCNALSAQERERIVSVCCAPDFRDLSPRQIVPILAENGEYIASESTIYRILGALGLLVHRSRSKAPERKRPEAITASAPNQVWTWDISYMLTLSRGVYLYLYLILDIWDRSIVGWAVHPLESGEHAADLLHESCIRQGVHRGNLVVHQDNGGPMISGEFLAMLSRWGVASYSRPGVSDDNAFSESLFRTLKYRPGYPDRFESLDEACEWMESFVDWYNNHHRHSGIGLVTPMQRRTGQDFAILETRGETYDNARRAHPERWSGKARAWKRPEVVTLNERRTKKDRRKEAA